MEFCIGYTLIIKALTHKLAITNTRCKNIILSKIALRLVIMWKVTKNTVKRIEPHIMQTIFKKVIQFFMFTYENCPEIDINCLDEKVYKKKIYYYYILFYAIKNVILRVLEKNPESTLFIMHNLQQYLFWHPVQIFNHYVHRCYMLQL